MRIGEAACAEETPEPSPAEHKKRRYRRCGFRHERCLRAIGFSVIAGIDEAGRGALAGPVVAAAVILPEKFKHRGLNDSKQLAPELREEIYCELVCNPEVGW